MAVYVALKHWAGNVSGCTDLVARHFFDDVVSFMHPHSPASLSLGGEAHMLPLFSVEADKEDADTHWLGGTVQLGATAPLDIAFDINQDEVDDNLAEHISMDSEFPSDDDARRVFVVRFSRHEDGGADCDYMRIDVPLEDACALVGKEEAAALRADSERHALERQRLEAEMIGAARGARRVARRAAGGLKKGAKKAGRAGKKAAGGAKKKAKGTARVVGRKAKKAGGAIKRKAKGTGRVVKRKAKKAYAGSKKLATKGRERAKSAYRKARTSNSRATASKGLGEIASKGKAKQAALKQQREKPLPATPKQKAPSKPVGKKPAAPGTQKQAAQKAAAKKTAAKKTAAKSKAKAKDGKKKAAAAKKPADKPAAKGGGLGLPGAGSPGGGAGEAPGGGGEPAGGGGEGFGGGGGAPMGPVVLPGASPDEVPPRAAFISVVPRPVPDEGALVEPASVFDDPYADEDQFLEDQDLEYDEDFVEDEIGDELDDDYDDDDEDGDDEDGDEDEDDDDEDDEWLGDEMAGHAEKWARIVSPSDRWQYVQGHLEALAWSESCNEPHVYVADIAVALAS